MGVLRTLAESKRSAGAGEIALGRPLSTDLCRNLLVIGVLGASLLFAAYYESYLGMITLPFWGILLGGFGLAVWLAFTESTARILSLIVAVFVIEYMKEGIGIRCGLWTYHGTNGSFIFGVWAWVLAGITCFVVGTKVVTPSLSRLPPVSSRLNPVILVILAAVGMVFLRNHLNELTWLYWAFYGLLLLVALLRSKALEYPLFVGLVIASWIVGNISEYAGSVGSGIWTFRGHPSYPPAFLLVACWPIEIVAQYSLARLMVPCSTEPHQLGEEE